ncbi:hypothetical protein [Nocardioides nitrophenolicus]|uniref:hypothetical protein n=1 Tax=Nocardioides nitrophenolicus TaxID=60489 RepID=UPI00195C3C9D|nr:hypothetical protein [Nocardioides nitrophenolicus]MBM7515676.1 hypothetical protein [Nocardioides nitrophenolicus]
MTTASRRRPTGRLARCVVGAFFLVTGGVHLGIVISDAEFYRPFADEALFPFVRDAWAEVFMARPELYGLLLMAGEIALGGCLLVGGRAARVGWAGVIAFHLLLVLFGWGFLFWVVPALGVLVPLAWRDLASERR